MIPVRVTAVELDASPAVLHVLRHRTLATDGMPDAAAYRRPGHRQPSLRRDRHQLGRARAALLLAALVLLRLLPQGITGRIFKKSL